MKTNEMVSVFFGWVWIITWFIGIWSPVYKPELFATGLFSLVLGLIENRDQEHQEQEGNNENHHTP